MDFDTSNDPQYNTLKNNPYAIPTALNMKVGSDGSGGVVTTTSDRHVRLGDGIPSGIVVTGDKILIGCGGGLCTTSTTPGGQVFPVYWRQR